MHLRRILISAIVAGMGVAHGLAQESEQKPAPKQEQKQATTPPAQSAPPAKGAADPKPGTPAAAKSAPPADAPATKPDPEAELQRAVIEAGNDRAALVIKLDEYLKKYPETPYKPEVFRAIVEASVQLKEPKRALEYAERYVALRPDDAAMLLFAVDLLEQAGDDASLRRAVGYATRVLDRVEKTGVDRKPPRTSQEEWEEQQRRLQMSIYLVRGRLEMERKNYEAAVGDLQKSFTLKANPAAALRLGEIAELRGEKEKAIEQFVMAFVLPDQYGVPVDRSEVRRKLGNLWKQVYGTESGLGQRLLETYDRTTAESKPAAATKHNEGVRDLHEVELRRLDGGAPVKLSEAKGKVLVLNFWATWCLPCRELEPLFEGVERQYGGQADVMFFAVNTDEDEGLVRPYVEREKVKSVVVLADGLDQWMKISSIPTVMVLDREGKIVYRASGFAPEGFVEALSQAIEKAKMGTT